MSGKAYFSVEDYPRAKIQFNKALNIDPNFAEAYYYLGLIDQEQGAFDGALENVLKAAQIEPGRLKYRATLGVYLADVGQFERAIAIAKTLEGSSGFEVQALQIMASVFLAEKDFNLALHYSERGLSYQAENLELLALKAAALKFLNRFDEALAVLEYSIGLEEDPSFSLLIRLDIARELGDTLQVQVDLERLCQLNKNNANYAVSLAQFHYQNNNIYKAKLVLENFSIDNPNNFQVRKLILSLLDEQSSEKASALLTRYIERFPDQYGFQFMQVSRWLAEGKQDNASALLRVIVEDDSTVDARTRTKAMVILAQLAIANKENFRAKHYLDAAIKLSPNHLQANLLRAKYFIQQENFGAAISDLNTIIVLEKESIEVLELIGLCYRRISDFDRAHGAYDALLIKQPEHISAALFESEYARVHEDLARALAILETPLQKHPKEILLIEQKLNVLVDMHEWRSVKAILLQLDEVFPGDARQHYYTGLIAFRQGRFDEAIVELKLAIKISPEHKDSYILIREAYLKKDRHSAWLDYLSFLKKEAPKALNPYLFIVNEDRENQDTAIRILNQALTEIPSWLDGYSILANIYLKKHDKDMAETVYLEGLERRGFQAELALPLAQLYQSLGKYSKAIQYYEALIRAGDETLLVLNNFAYLLADNGGEYHLLDLARVKIADFSNSNNADLLDTYAWLAYRMQALEEASEALEKVIELSPDEAVFRYHFAEVLLALNQEPEAKLQYQIGLELLGDDVNLGIEEKIKRRINQLQVSFN